QHANKQANATMVFSLCTSAWAASYVPIHVAKGQASTRRLPAPRRPTARPRPRYARAGRDREEGEGTQRGIDSPGVIYAELDRSDSLLAALTRHVPKISHAQALKLARLGAVYYRPPRDHRFARLGNPLTPIGAADGEEVSKMSVEAGGELRVHSEPRRYPGCAAESPAAWAERLRYVGRDFVVVDKPAGVPCAPHVSNGREWLVPFAGAALMFYLASRGNSNSDNNSNNRNNNSNNRNSSNSNSNNDKNNNNDNDNNNNSNNNNNDKNNNSSDTKVPQLLPCHRLDVGTSGLVTLARSKGAAARFNDLISDYCMFHSPGSLLLPGATS
ncbi:unnamed protein product, partial [Polarella glacialis]